MDLRAVLYDLTGPVARWLVAGLLLLALVLVVATVVTDHEVSAQQLLGVGFGTLVYGRLALTATIGLGNMARML